MKTTNHKTTILTAVLLAAGLCAWAQLAIDWHTINGGGGTSSGGDYTLSGTVGQYDASAVQMTGGSFTLNGGFWSVFAVQTEGAPYLMVEITGSSEVTISWAPDDPGWVLQETPVLEPAAWTNSPVASTNPITISVSQPTTFYRLQKP